MPKRVLFLSFLFFLVTKGFGTGMLGYPSLSAWLCYLGHISILGSGLMWWCVQHCDRVNVDLGRLSYWEGLLHAVCASADLSTLRDMHKCEQYLCMHFYEPIFSIGKHLQDIYSKLTAARPHHTVLSLPHAVYLLTHAYAHFALLNKHEGQKCTLTNTMAMLSLGSGLSR